MKCVKFDLLVNNILEALAFGSNTLYYPNKNAVKGTDMGMTQVDPSKTFPSSDSTMILKLPKNKKRIKKIKQ